ncbi:type I glutamate--ammonia ligase [Kosmotoga olearia]|uniref:Glutamine synthetase n=1 Tax=Kosmotoga olearia (strain ATCC BAA-1733 / DSM 21960 / TBF 19.5.1) TaxID=521045 RepID=C5CD71_KOSOT|nr:type I glutamate--ammonia ligase [Kosmotoga olearia]ACR79015.1 glutamine synthetase, type I [Kosmotoga olearia TBF 19.5.1]
MDKKSVLELVKRENVRFVRLQITDINGFLKNVEIPVKLLEKSLDEGVMFDGSSIDGFVRIEESDMYLIPDASTVALLPWKDDDEKTMRIICDVHLPNGEPFEGDPRYRLKKVVQRAKEMGFIAHAGPEPEFFLFKRDENSDRPIVGFMDRGSYFDMLPVDKGEETRKEIVISLEKMGFDIEAAHHEVAPSQHEIDFRYADILKTADNIQTFKWVVKTIALMNGLYATFMPKPFAQVNGSGMHIHLSLFENGKNAFYDPEKPYELSDVLLNFVGGIIKYAKELTIVTNPIINSYKRLVPGYEAPINISWALGNRSAMIRVPAARGQATRIEIRNPDPSCNPYLALAVLLEAGLRGIEEGILPPKPVGENIFKLNQTERKKRKIQNLPGNLNEALEYFSRSSLIKDVLGDHIYKKFLETKKKEWKEFMMHVTDWEKEKYLELY